MTEIENGGGNRQKRIVIQNKAEKDQMALTKSREETEKYVQKCGRRQNYSEKLKNRKGGKILKRSKNRTSVEKQRQQNGKIMISGH